MELLRGGEGSRPPMNSAELLAGSRPTCPGKKERVEQRRHEMGCLGTAVSEREKSSVPLQPATPATMERMLSVI